MRIYTLFFMAIALLITGCSKPKEQQAKAKNDEATIVKETPSTEKETNTMYPQLSTYIESVVSDLEDIPQERRDQLRKIALFVQTKKQSGEPANLVFICTHNSRRSHMSQIWATTAAEYYGIDEGIHTYSGGTEATAFNSRAVAAIRRCGFKAEAESLEAENPRYQVSYAEDSPEMICFSKKYDDPANANKNFVAVMTCSKADKNCPFIPGASLRVAIPYVDPKEADGTKAEAETYDKRCKQIATEMFYIMSEASKG